MAQYTLQLVLLGLRDDRPQLERRENLHRRDVVGDRPACWLRSAYPGSGKIACRQGSKTTRYIGGCYSIIYVKYSSTESADRDR